jgi:hypothetical protein
MSIIKDQIEGTDLFRQLSREGYYTTTIQRSKYLPRLEALYLGKNKLANPTLPNGEEVVCYYDRRLPQLLQNYLYQQGKDSESFFKMEPAIRSSIEAPAEAIRKLPDPESICTQDLLICHLYYFLTQTFFLGGTSPQRTRSVGRGRSKCPSYHPPTPYTLSPLLKGGEGRGEGGSYTHVPCPFGALLVTLYHFKSKAFLM